MPLLPHLYILRRSEEEVWSRTEQFPLAVGHVAGQVRPVSVQLQVDARHVVSPRAELHVTLLLVEREPRDVDPARAQEDARRHPQTDPQVKGQRSTARDIWVSATDAQLMRVRDRKYSGRYD